MSLVPAATAASDAGTPTTQSSTPNITTTKSDEETFSCPLCCEEKIPLKERRVLSKCNHVSCSSCCIKWIQKVEASGDEDRLPACPWCRVPMESEEVEKILGRPYQVATTKTTSLEAGATSGGEEEMDELTLQWLNEQTRPCPSCGARIFKIPGGCDLMECLCGFRFCYGCGSQGAQCNCTPAHHYFWDNVLDRAAQRTAPPQATTNNETGEIDLRNHIQKRVKAEEAAKTKRLRASRYQHYRQEVMTLDALASSAIWLYHPNNQSSLRILNEIVQKSKIAHIRFCTARTLRREFEQQQHQQRQVLPNRITTTAENHYGGLYGGKWLFECKGNGYKWLNYVTQSTNANLIKRSRHRQQLTNKRDLIHWDAMTRSATWLFTPTRKAGIRILAEQTSPQAQTRKISRRARRNESTLFWGVQIPIVNGSWLYRSTSSADQTKQQLTRMFEHQKKQQSVRDARRRRRQQLTVPGRRIPYLSSCSRGRDLDIRVMERENLENLQWLFGGTATTTTIEEEEQQQSQKNDQEVRIQRLEQFAAAALSG